MEGIFETNNPPEKKIEKLEIETPFIIMVRSVIAGELPVRVPVFKRQPKKIFLQEVLERTESKYYGVVIGKEGEEKITIYTSDNNNLMSELEVSNYDEDLKKILIKLGEASEGDFPKVTDIEKTSIQLSEIQKRNFRD